MTQRAQADDLWVHDMSRAEPVLSLVLPGSCHARELLFFKGEPCGGSLLLGPSPWGGPGWAQSSSRVCLQYSFIRAPGSWVVSLPNQTGARKASASSRVGNSTSA